jgi:hypothetical protein
MHVDQGAADENIVLNQTPSFLFAPEHSMQFTTDFHSFHGSTRLNKRQKGIPMWMYICFQENSTEKEESTLQLPTF